ncbi:lipocalin family protein [Agaribacter marinus]
MTGQNRDYLWIFARSPILGQSELNKLINVVDGLGFPVEELIFVTH